MNIHIQGRIVLLITTLLFNVAVCADETSAEPEVWSGMIERYSSPPLLVKYEITRDQNSEIHADMKLDSNKIVLKEYKRAFKEDNSVEFISFRFKPGLAEVECRLDRDNPEEEKFVGTCPPDTAFETAGTRRLTMERSANNGDGGIKNRPVFETDE